MSDREDELREAFIAGVGWKGNQMQRGIATGTLSENQAFERWLCIYEGSRRSRDEDVRSHEQEPVAKGRILTASDIGSLEIITSLSGVKARKLVGTDVALIPLSPAKEPER